MSAPNVIDFAAALAATRELDPPKREPIDPTGGGGDDGGMDLSDRVGHLETDMKDVRDRLSRIETRMDAFATKSDLSDVKSELIKWVVGTAVALGSAAIVVMTFVLNNATPKASTSPVQPPIIINVPQTAPIPSPIQK